MPTPEDPNTSDRFTLDRRRFLQLAAAAGAFAALPALTACDPADVRPVPGPATPGAFPQGVASGDPLATAVLLWTRIEPAGRPGPVTVRWELTANADDATAVLASGQAQTSADQDWTVLVDATGLQPGTYYRYRFFDDSRPGGVGTSVVGRTRTASSGAVQKVRLGVASCSWYSAGYFHAYRHLANRTMDAFVHLGDYIYEQASDASSARIVTPTKEVIALADYRERYRCYRNDPDLQELHRLHPMMHVWDDHEFANDPFPGGAGNHTPATEGTWTARVNAAVQAYREWIPTRLDGTKIYRTFDFGSLGRLILVDRQRRNLWPQTGDSDLYLGLEQMNWLDGQIASTTAPWTILGTGTLFSMWQVNAGATANSWPLRDQLRVVNGCRAVGTDLVVLSGDVHRFQATEVALDATYSPGTGRGSGGVEFTSSSITSPHYDVDPPGSKVRWFDTADRGYAMVTIEPTQVQCDYWGFPNAGIKSSALPAERLLNSLVVRKGTPALVQATGGNS